MEKKINEGEKILQEKTDPEQLKGILKQFSPTTIQEVGREYFEGKYCQKSFRDFPDPGPEIKVGEDNVVAYEDIGYLERIIQEPNFLPVHFLEEGAIIQKAVARITRNGGSWGTGFLISPSLFMTNNHVISSESMARQMDMHFNYQLDYLGNPQTVDSYSPDPDDVFYTNSTLDFTLIRISSKCRWSMLPIGVLNIRDEYYENTMEWTPNPRPMPLPGPFPQPRPRPPMMPPIPRQPPIIQPQPRPPIAWRRICTSPGQAWGYIQLSNSIVYANNEHVNIIQHPQGRRKEVALQANKITNMYSNTTRYTTDTEPGSSGSPVFNNQWDLIALHHAAGECDARDASDRCIRWINNEGMRIDKIVADLRNHFSGSTTGEQILAELGI